MKAFPGPLGTWGPKSRLMVRRVISALAGWWLGFGVFLSGSPAAQAAASFWRKAANPEVARAETIKRAAERVREPRALDLGSGAILAKLNQRAAVAIQLAGGAELDDVELTYLLGHCLAHASGAYFEQAIEVLERVLQQAPDHPLAARGWRDLAHVASALNRFETERRAHEQALALEWRQGVRSEIYLERGLARMAQAHLELAAEDFQAASQEAALSEQWAFSQWSLAVALDRHGDSPAAVALVQRAAQARFGPAGRLTVLQIPVARFRVSYDLHYYMALERMARAQTAADDALGRADLQAAQLMWLRYLDAAIEGDPWRSRVRQHLDWIARKQGPDNEEDLDAQALEPMRLDE